MTASVSSGLPGSMHDGLQDVRYQFPNHRGDNWSRPPNAVRPGQRQVSGAMASTTCDIHCKLKIAAADGFQRSRRGLRRAPASTTGSYGTCNRTARSRPTAGDGVVNGSPKCDSRSHQLSEHRLPASAPATKTCALGPYCGDGRIETIYGEQYDGTLGCNRMCRVIMVRETLSPLREAGFGFQMRVRNAPDFQTVTSRSQACSNAAGEERSCARTSSRSAWQAWTLTSILRRATWRKPSPFHRRFAERKISASRSDQAAGRSSSRNCSLTRYPGRRRSFVEQRSKAVPRLPSPPGQRSRTRCSS